MTAWYLQPPVSLWGGVVDRHGEAYRTDATEYLDIECRVPLPVDARISFAFVDVGAAPGPEAWTLGGWDSDEQRATILVGRAGVQLEPGIWDVWVLAEAGPEAIVGRRGRITVEG